MFFYRLENYHKCIISECSHLFKSNNFHLTCYLLYTGAAASRVQLRFSLLLQTFVEFFILKDKKPFVQGSWIPEQVNCNLGLNQHNVRKAFPPPFSYNAFIALMLKKQQGVIARPSFSFSLSVSQGERLEGRHGHRNIITSQSKHCLEFLMKSEKPSYTRGPQAAGTQNTQHIHFSITLQDLPSSREKVVCCFWGQCCFPNALRWKQSPMTTHPEPGSV